MKNISLYSNTFDWWTPDPAAELYYSTSPYAYVSNNPMNAIGPNGLWENAPNDYFDFSGKYLGSDMDQNNNNVYLIAPSIWEATKGEEWTTKVLGSVSLEDANGIDKNRVFKEIGNRYYNETGYSLSELENSSITVRDDWRSLATTSDINSNKLLELNITLPYFGSTLSNRYDFINLMVHERGYHGTRLLKGEKWDPLNNAGQYQLWESEAYRGQMNHSSWGKTSPKYRKHILNASEEYLK